VKEYDLKVINEERHKMEVHYQQLIENMERQLAIQKDELENKKQLQYEKMKDIESQYQSEKGRYLSTIRGLEDEVSRKDIELSDLRAKEKEAQELIRNKEELVRQRTNLEKELSSVNKQCFEANELVKEMEVSLRNQRHMSIQYEQELGKAEKELQDYRMKAEKLEKEARYYQSKLDECQATMEKLQRQVDYEKDQKQGVKERYEEELDRYKRENEETIQSYEKDRKESLFKVRVLEDAAAEDRMIIDGLRKQLRKYQMGQI
jgi:chromosome segregation ATPase